MRKETIITLSDDGKELKFRVRQMSASHLYDYIIRLVLALSHSGLKLTDGDEADLSKVGEHIMANGLQALRGVEHGMAKPLLDEMLACCSRISDSGVEQVVTPDSLDGFISDPRTIFKLQFEAAKLNFGFLGEAAESHSNSPEALNIGKPATQKV